MSSQFPLLAIAQLSCGSDKPTWLVGWTNGIGWTNYLGSFPKTRTRLDCSKWSGNHKVYHLAVSAPTIVDNTLFLEAQEVLPTAILIWKPGINFSPFPKHNGLHSRNGHKVPSDVGKHTTRSCIPHVIVEISLIRLALANWGSLLKAYVSQIYVHPSGQLSRDDNQIFKICGVKFVSDFI